MTATQENWEKLRRPFLPEQIEKLQKFTNGPALDYIGHATITERLQECDPEWNIQFAYHYPPTHELAGLPVMDSENGYAWFNLTIFGVTKLCVGDTGGKPMHSNGVKEMMGDAIRNGAMRFGVGTYLWSRSEEALMKKSTPFWEENIDALKTAEEVRALMKDWQSRGITNTVINRYAFKVIERLENDSE